MELLVRVLERVVDFSANALLRMIPALVVCNVVLEMGLLKRLMPVAKRFTMLAHLPPEASIPFISSFGSGYAGGAIVVNLYERRVLDERQAVLAAMTLSIPVFFREFVSIFLPVVVSILGGKLGFLYLAIRFLVIIVKTLFIILWGKRYPAQNWSDVEEDRTKKERETMVGKIKAGLKSSYRPLKRMALTIPAAAFFVFLLKELGVFSYPVEAIANMGIPSYAVPPVICYVASPMAGLSMIAALYNGSSLTLLEALTVMLMGSLLHLPVIMLRFAATYYLSVYGPKLGTKILFLSFGISAFVYVVCLLLVLCFQIQRGK